MLNDASSNPPVEGAVDDAVLPPDRLPFGFAKRHGIIWKPMTDDAATDILYYRAPLNPQIFAELQRYLQRPLTLQAIPGDEFELKLAQAYESDHSKTQQMAEEIGDEMDLSTLIDDLPTPEDLLDSEDDAPIIRLLNALFSQAIKQQASDIHIEAFEDKVVVRFRIDGVLQEILQPQRVLAPLITSRIKVMAKLDIAEKRLPQDGRIALRIAGRAVDVRVSTMPTSHGERVVMRLLDKNNARLDLAHLGMFPESMALMQNIIAHPHGIILVTGPTGSGKTTSLYAVLSVLNRPDSNILTVEDPIEYHLAGIGQTQVNTKVNMTFAKGLRAMLRQDPDVVMVGEIRDLETAQIAVQASLTGHLVLSTLHTNTAIGAITRLRDMGIEPFLLSSSLVGVIAQRLVRVLCPHCKEALPATERECRLLRISEGQDIPLIHHPKGCGHCHQQGYSGRTGIYEIVPIDEQLRSMIHNDTPESNMMRYSRSHHASIRRDGIRRVLAGQTTLEEVLRVTTEGEEG